MSTPEFFPAEVAAPEPPKDLAECGPEWRIGWVVGWETGPAIAPAWKGRYPKIGRFSPMAGKRQRAVKEGVEAGREAKRALVTEYLDSISCEGQPTIAYWGGYTRHGWLYADAFFFPYSTSKLPACVPLSAIKVLETQP